MRIEAGEGDWVAIEKDPFLGCYNVTFGYNDNEVDAKVVTSLDELRQIVAAIEKMEAFAVKGDDEEDDGA